MENTAENFDPQNVPSPENSEETGNLETSEETQSSEEPQPNEEPQLSAEPQASEESQPSEEPEVSAEPKEIEESQASEEPEVSTEPQASEESQVSEEPESEEESTSIEADSESLKHGQNISDEIEDVDHDDLIDENEEEEEPEEEIDFAEAGKQDLLTYLDGVLKNDKILQQANRVREARTRFDALLEEDRKKALEEFLAIEGNNEIDFQFPLQYIDRQWRESMRAYAKRKKNLRESIIKEREDNLKKKNDILEKIKELTEEATKQDAFSQLKALQEDWRKIGQVPASDADNLYKNYRFLNDKFFEQRAIIKEFLELDRKKNMEAKLEIIDAIKTLSETDEPLGVMMRNLRSLQDSWRDTGPIPKENLDEVMSAYREANELITKKKEALVEVLESERETNLKTKEALIEKILELTDDENNKTWVKRNKELSALILAWKKVGPVPKKESERMRQEFRESVKVFNKLKNTFFKEQKREKLTNLELKVEACQKVEALLKKEGDLKNHRQDVIKIQQYWKTIGPVPRNQSDEVWNRFRKSCDDFFNRLKAAENEAFAEQIDNLKKKQEICEKIEALAKQDEANTDDLVPLEEAFRGIGFVPFKEKKGIDERFRKAVKSVLSEAVNLEIDVKDPVLEKYRKKVEDFLRDENAVKQLDREMFSIRKEKKQLEDEAHTLETNMSFFANSKNAEKLMEEINQKIAAIRGKIDLIGKKEDLLRQSYAFTRN